MKEKLLMAIAITFSLSCVHSLSVTTTARAGDAIHIDLSPRQIASLWLQHGANP